LRVSVIQEAMLVEASGRVTQTRQALVERLREIPWSSRLGIGRRADNSAPLKLNVAKNSVMEPDCPHENDLDYETRIWIW